jgi:hypothetical protein
MKITTTYDVENPSTRLGQAQKICGRVKQILFDLKNIRKYTKKIKFFIVRNKMPLLIRDYTWDETEKIAN